MDVKWVMIGWIIQCLDVKTFSPGDEMTGVSSLFTLIASQGTVPSPTAVSWRPEDVPLRSPKRTCGKLFITSPSVLRKSFNSYITVTLLPTEPGSTFSLKGI